MPQLVDQIANRLVEVHFLDHSAAVVEAHEAAERETDQARLELADELDLGAQFFIWEVATAAAGFFLAGLGFANIFPLVFSLVITVCLTAPAWLSARSS